PARSRRRRDARIRRMPRGRVESVSAFARSAGSGARRIRRSRRMRLLSMATIYSATEPDEGPEDLPPREVDLDKIERGVRLILEGVGEDLQRPGLQRTPERVAEMYAELTAGMREDAREHVRALPGDRHDEMVIVKDISFASLCEHHLAPFVGKCHIAYIPKEGRIVGLSKLARLVETFARRLQVQERLTSEIADTLFEGLKPVGVMVVME